MMLKSLRNDTQIEIQQAFVHPLLRCSRTQVVLKIENQKAAAENKKRTGSTSTNSGITFASHMADLTRGSACVSTPSVGHFGDFSGRPRRNAAYDKMSERMNSNEDT